jgi:hypothetical protein
VLLMVDSDGYGARRGQTSIERLLEDCRTLSPVGIERIASGWDTRHGTAFPAAEKAALHAIETHGRTQDWDALRNQILGLTERGTPLISWRLEHGANGHKAEDALMAAALALTAAGSGLARAHAETLIAPMSEALPWLTTAVAAAI